MKWIMLAACFLVLGGYLEAQTFAVHFENRQRGCDEFDAYIARGIRNGELSDREIYKLRQEWEELQIVKRKAYRNGYISHREKRRLWEAEKDFEHKLHSYMNNRERDHHRKYEKRHREDRYYRDGDRDRYNRYDRH